MSSNYLIEYISRKNFFLKHCLDEKNRKIEQINSNLENEIKERLQEINSAYEKLRTSEVYHRNILSNLGEGVTISDLNENFLFANDAAERIFGVPGGKLIGRNLVEFTTSESLVTLQEQAEISHAGGTSQFEIEIISNEKESVYIAITGKPEFNEKGEQTGVLRIFRNINTRKKIEDEMRWRLDYELLMSSISNNFVGVYDFQESIPQALAEFGNFIKAEKVFLYETDIDKKLLKRTFEWNNGEAEIPEGLWENLELDKIKHTMKKLDRESVINFNNEKRAALQKEKRLLTDSSDKCLIIIPIKIHQALVALIGFTYNKASCIWSDKFLALVNVLGDIFGHAYERKNYELLIQTQLLEKESLLKEIHHRVKNNMQIITSIVRLQTRFLTNVDIDDILLNFQNRMQSMYQAYNKVFLSGSFSKIDFERYLSSLIIDLYYSLDISNKNIEVESDLDQVELDINIVIPLGLIIYEIVSNALKHAFPDNRKGKISITFKVLKNDEFFLKICDNGVGIKPGFNFVQADSLGSLLVHILSTQIKAEVNIEKKDGTIFTLKFKNLELKTFSNF